MKINDRKIREDIKSYAVLDYDRDKMQETLTSCREAYGKRLLSKRIGFWEFIAMQVRYIGRWVWLAQAAFLLLFLFFFSSFHLGVADMQAVFLLLSLFAPVIAFIGFPEILKSSAHGMEEIEACTRFSMPKLMGARMLILGLADLCSLTILLAISAAGHGDIMLRMILYLLVPFNLTCCICMTVLGRVKSRYRGYYSGVLCAFCVVLFYRLSLLENYYETAATGVWVIMLILSLLYLAFAIVRVFKSFDRICFCDEICSVTWK